MREIAHVEDMTKFNTAVDNLKQLQFGMKIRLVPREMAETVEGTEILSCIWQPVILKHTRTQFAI